MGKRGDVWRKLEVCFGRKFKASKLRSRLKLLISHLCVLRNQRRFRLDQARSDVVELLRQGHHRRAVLGAEFIIKEQNLLEAFDIIESYCHVLSERAGLLEQQSSECPEELREAISGLMYAQPRCDQLYELHDIRKIITSKLGKGFISSVVELQEPGVNPYIIQMLSTKQPSAEMMTRVARDIAMENGIDFGIKSKGSRDERKGYLYSDSPKMKYKNATDAALDAFTSAAYAAAAAKEALVLSRMESRGHGRSSSSSSME